MVDPAPALTAAVRISTRVIDNIFLHPNVPPFVATRLIRSMVTCNPSPAYVTRVSNAFINNGAGVRGDLARGGRAPSCSTPRRSRRRWPSTAA